MGVKIEPSPKLTQLRKCFSDFQMEWSFSNHNDTAWEREADSRSRVSKDAVHPCLDRYLQVP